MKHIILSIRRPGMPAQRIDGLFLSTFDAVRQGLEILGEQQGSVSAWVAP